MAGRTTGLRDQPATSGRIARLSDLPGDAALKALVRQAAAINASGVKSARPRKNGGAPPEVPDDRQK